MKRLLGASVLVAGGVAWASPVATTSADVDGDGKADEVAVDGTGTVSINGKQVATLGANVTTARVMAGRPKDKPTIVIATQARAYVLAGPSWKVATTTEIGGVGLDADYAMDVTITSIGVVKYQTRPGLQRCDGKPALLFAEGWNGTKWGRLSRPPAEVTTTQTIKAVPATGPLRAPMLFHATFASHEPGATDAGALVAPDELGDGKIEPAWHEELATSAGEGQMFTFEPRIASGARSLVIVPGDASNTKVTRVSRRVTSMFVVSKNAAFKVEIPAPANETHGAAYTVDFNPALEGCVSVIIDDTTGSAAGPTTIGELSIFGDGELEGGAAHVLVAVVAAGNGNQTIYQQLARDAQAASAEIDTLLATAKPVERKRLIEALVQMNVPETATPLTKAIEKHWLQGQRLLAAVQTLANGHQSKVMAPLAANTTLSIDARIIAVGGIGLDADGVQALVGLAGGSDTRVRKAVIEKLSELPAAQLMPLVENQSAAASGDVLRAAVRRARAHVDEQALVLPALLALLPAATDYDHRYRAIDGVAELGDAGALKRLSAVLAALPHDAEGAALRQVAVEGLSKTPRAEAAELLATLATDSDPGVRLAAVRSFRALEADASGPWHVSSPDGIDRVLGVALANDRWPDVRREAASVLGARCQRQAPREALVTSVGKEKDKDVKNEALDALVTCHASGIAALLEKTWSDENADIEVRAHAVRLAGRLEDPALGKTLVARFTQWRSDAL
ncbi:MAG TPA: HEAT repeat domain-containing protein, partial [Kofleriaceae bacterium]